MQWLRNDNGRRRSRHDYENGAEPMDCTGTRSHDSAYAWPQREPELDDGAQWMETDKDHLRCLVESARVVRGNAFDPNMYYVTDSGMLIPVPSKLADHMQYDANSMSWQRDGCAQRSWPKFAANQGWSVTGSIACSDDNGDEDATNVANVPKIATPGAMRLVAPFYGSRPSWTFRHATAQVISRMPPGDKKEVFRAMRSTESSPEDLFFPEIGITGGDFSFGQGVHK